jgi:hypothetical protein
LTEPGGKIELRLRSVDADVVRYSLALDSPEHRFPGTAEVALVDGNVRFDLPGEAPVWLISATRGLLRMLWRDRRKPGAQAWPRRITRWRSRR